MLNVLILVSGKTSNFSLLSFACLNTDAYFSSEGVLSCSASENKQKSCVHALPEIRDKMAVARAH